MNINEKSLEKKILKEGQVREKLVSLNFNQNGLILLSLSTMWNQIEYLSLRGNLIKTVSFLEYFPKLFYLDLLDNPIEDFRIFSTFNSFGFLGLTPPENYLERKILVMKKMNVGILNLEIKDINNYSIFIMNNPNILIFNNKLISFEEKILFFKRVEEEELLTSYSNRKLNKVSKVKTISSNKSKMPVFISSKNFAELFKDEELYSNSETSKIEELMHLKFATRFAEKLKQTQYLEEKFTLKNCATENEKITKMSKSLSAYNNKMISLYKNSLSEDGVICNNLYFCKDYFKLQKKLLLGVSELYQSILSLNVRNNQQYFKYVSAKNTTLSEDLHYFTYPYINISLFKLSSVPLQAIVLSLLLDYLFGIIPKSMCQIIMFSFYSKYKCKTVPSDVISYNICLILNVDPFYLICFYLEIYKYFSSMCKAKIKDKDQTSINYSHFLQMFKLTNLSNKTESIIQHKKKAADFFEARETNKKTEFINENFIRFFKRLNIFFELYNTTQLVYDFLLLNDLEDQIIKENYVSYQLFLEIKDNMFKILPDDYFGEDKQSFCDLIFNELQLKELSNKFFFKGRSRNVLSSFFKRNYIRSLNRGIFPSLIDQKLVRKNKNSSQDFSDNSLYLQRSEMSRNKNSKRNIVNLVYLKNQSAQLNQSLSMSYLEENQDNLSRKLKSIQIIPRSKIRLKPIATKSRSLDISPTKIYADKREYPQISQQRKLQKNLVLNRTKSTNTSFLRTYKKGLLGNLSKKKLPMPKGTRNKPSKLKNIQRVLSISINKISIS